MNTLLHEVVSPAACKVVHEVVSPAACKVVLYLSS